MENKEELRKYIRSVFNMLNESLDESPKEEQSTQNDNHSISNDDLKIVMENEEKQDENMS